MHNIQWRDLELFLAIDRAGSLSGAARAIGIEQSTVSRRLTELETRIGQALFVRRRDGVTATALGHSWRDPAIRSEAGVIDVQRITTGHVHDIRGEVRLASLLTISDYFLAPRLPALLDAYPGLRLSILSSPAITDLTRLEADLALRLVRPRTGDLVARTVGTSHLSAFATASLATQLADRPIREWPWIGWASPSLSPPPLTAWFQAQGIVPRITILSPTTLLAATLAGAGVGVIGETLAALTPDLVKVPVPSLPPIEAPFWLVTHRELRHVPRIAVVWDWLIEGFAEAMTP